MREAFQDVHVLLLADILADRLLIQAGILPQKFRDFFWIRVAGSIAQETVLGEFRDTLPRILVELLRAKDQPLERESLVTIAVTRKM